MALKASGVDLKANGASQFIQDLNQSNTAMTALHTATNAASSAMSGFSQASTNALKISALSEKIDLQNKQLKIMTSELGAVEQKYGTSSIQAQKKQLAIDRLNTSITQNTRQLHLLETAEAAETTKAATATQQSQQLATAQLKTATEASKAATQSAQLAKEETNVGNAAEAAHPKVSALGQIAVGALRQIGALAVSAMAQAGTAITGFITSSFSVGAEFGSVMNHVQAVSGATTEQIQAMNEKAMQLGKDLPLSAKDAADGMYALATAGFNANETLAASAGVAELAATQHMAVGQAAEIAAAGIRGFRLNASDAGMVTDVLTQAAASSAVEVSDLGETLKYVAPIAGAVGISFKDLSVMMALVGNSGIKASDAGTALRSIITRLAAPPKTTAGELEHLGIVTNDASKKVVKSVDEINKEISKWGQSTSSSAETSQKLQLALADLGVSALGANGKVANTSEMMKRLKAVLADTTVSTDKKRVALEELGLSYEKTTGNLKDFIGHAAGQKGLLDDLREKFKGMSQAEQIEAAKNIAGQEAMSAFLVLMNSSDDDFKNMVAAMDNAGGAADRFGQSMNKGAGYELEQLKGSIDNIRIQGFQLLEPVLISALQHFTGVANVVSDFAGALLKAQDPFKFLSAQASGLLTTLGNAVPAIQPVTGAIQTLTTAFTAGGLPLVLASIEGSIRSAFGEQSAQSFHAITQAVGAVATAFQAGGIQFAIAAIEGQIRSALGERTFQQITQIADVIKNALSSAFTVASQGATRLFGFLKDRASDLQSTLGPALATIQSNLGPMLATIQSNLGPVLATIQSSLQGAFGEKVPQAIHAVEQAVTAISTAFKAGGLPLVLKTIDDSIRSAFGPQTAEHFEQITSIVQGALTLAWNGAQTAITLVSQAIQGLRDHWNEINGAIQTSIQFLQQNFQPIAAGVAAMATAVLVPALIATTTAAVVGFGAWAAAAGAAALATLAAAAPLVVIGLAVGLAVAAWQNDWGGIQEKTQAVWGVIGPILGSIKDWLGVHIPQAINAVGQAWTWLSTNTAAMAASVGGFFNSLGTTIHTVSSSIYNAVTGFFTNLYNALVGHSIIPDMVNGILSWFGQLKANTIDRVGQMKDEIIARVLVLKETAVNYFELFKTLALSAVEALKSEAIAKATELRDTIVDRVTSLKDDALTAVTNLQTQAIATITTLKTNAIRLFTDIKTTVTGAAGIVPTMINLAVQQIDAIIERVTGQSGVLSNLLAAIRGMEGQFLQAGKDLMQGVINGVGQMGSALTSKITSLAQSALDAWKNFWDSHSPSMRAEKEMGEPVVQGAINGITKKAGEFYDSMAKLGMGGVTAFNGGWNKAAATAGMGGFPGSAVPGGTTGADGVGIGAYPSSTPAASGTIGIGIGPGYGKAGGGDIGIGMGNWPSIPAPVPVPIGVGMGPGTVSPPAPAQTAVTSNTYAPVTNNFYNLTTVSPAAPVGIQGDFAIMQVLNSR